MWRALLGGCRLLRSRSAAPVVGAPRAGGSAAVRNAGGGGAAAAAPEWRQATGRARERGRGRCSRVWAVIAAALAASVLWGTRAGRVPRSLSSEAFVHGYGAGFLTPSVPVLACSRCSFVRLRLYIGKYGAWFCVVARCALPQRGADGLK